MIHQARADPNNPLEVGVVPVRAAVVAQEQNNEQTARRTDGQVRDVEQRVNPLARRLRWSVSS